MTDSSSTTLCDRKLTNDGSLFFLFLKALRIGDECPSEEPPAPDDCAGATPFDLSWVVHYNLALSCHLLGCQLGEQGHEHLQYAHDVYGFIIKHLLVQAPLEYWTILSLALFNNAGCIYREFAMHEEFVACLDLARDMLVSLPSDIVGGADMLTEFELNLMILERPTSAGAA
jgi:hypothetical protein